MVCDALQNSSQILKASTATPNSKLTPWQVPLPSLPLIKSSTGIIQPELLEDGRVRVDMGEPVLEGPKIPTTLPTDPKTGYVVQQELVIEGDTYTVTAVSMGNPHASVYSKNGQPIKVNEIDLFHLGPIFLRHEVFPALVITEFVEILDRSHVKMVVWERGPGHTLGCGTGACALVVAGVLENRLDRRCNVSMPGGALDIEWDAETNHIRMTGPAEFVFSGSVTLPLDKE